jgi:hypothetical protein
VELKMLYLNPQIIDGVTFFPDRTDSAKYYYLPQEPQLVQRNDILQLRLIKYRGRTDAGGIFTIAVDLGIDKDRLQLLSSKLNAKENLRFEAVPTIAGSVKLIMFGKTYGPVQPALFGDNQAVFSLALTPTEVPLLESALSRAEFTSIGILYTLDYLALRPAYSFQIHANWERVQRHLEETFSVNLIFFKIDIEKVVNELVEKQVIEIKLDSFTPEEDTRDRDRALQEMQATVLTSFFEPQLNPAKTEAKPDILGFSYRRVETITIDQRSLNLTMNEETLVRRSLYPQGNLQGLLQKIKGKAVDPTDLITAITLDDLFYKQRKVQVISRANFEADSIQLITVTLQYGDEIKSIVLMSSLARIDVKPWNSILEQGVIQRDVKTRYQVTFKNVDSTQQPSMLESSEKTTIFDYLEINPRELYAIISIPIFTITSFPWQRYESVQVRVRYIDEGNGIRLEQTFFLQSSGSEKYWNMFVKDSQKQRFQYQLIYKPTPGNSYYKTSWIEGEGQIVINNPFPQRRTVTVISLLNWTKIKAVSVELFYQDLNNKINENKQLEFTESDSDAKVFSANLLNPDQYLVKYQVTFIFKNENTWVIPESTTLDRRIFIQEEMKGHQIIKIKAEAIDFKVTNIQEILIEASYEDSAAGLKNVQSFIFDSSDDYAYFEFDYVSDRRKQYRYRTTYRFLNHPPGITDWQEGDTETLVLEAKTLQDFFNLPLPKEPIEENFSVEISPEGLDWQQIKSVTVKLLYEDKEREIKESGKNEFKPENSELFLWQPEKVEGLKRYKWQAVFLLKTKSANKRYYPGSKSNDWEETEKQQIMLKDYVNLEKR